MHRVAGMEPLVAAPQSAVPVGYYGEEILQVQLYPAPTRVYPPPPAGPAAVPGPVPHIYPPAPRTAAFSPPNGLSPAVRPPFLYLCGHPQPAQPAMAMGPGFNGPLMSGDTSGSSTPSGLSSEGLADEQERMEPNNHTPLEQQYDNVVPMDTHFATPSVVSNTSVASNASDEGIHSGRDDANEFDFDESVKDYRRFSGRNRKKTEFFGVNHMRRNEEQRMFRQGRGGGRRGRPPASTRPFNFMYQAPFVSRAPAEVGNQAITPPSSSSPASGLALEDLKKTYPIGRMVFGKLPGYPWWAGYIASHQFCEGARGQVAKLWISWYGESDLSHIALDKIEPFEEFEKCFSPRDLKTELYKSSVVIALETAAKRGKVRFTSNPEDKSHMWVIPEGQSVPVLVSERELLDTSISTNTSEETANPEEAAEAAITPPNPEEEDLPATEPKKRRKRRRMSRGRPKKSKKKQPGSGDIFLTNYEHELLDWAWSGFPPCGSMGFWPSDSEQEELEMPVGPVPVGPGGKPLGGVACGAGEPPAKRAKMMVKPLVRANFTAASEGKLALSDICLSCGDQKVVAQHPLFEGGLCKECKGFFMQCTYQFDDDGSQMYCSICSGGDEVYMCDTENCAKVFCGPCIEKLCGAQELKDVIEAENWTCYMCKDVPKVGLLAKRPDWDLKLRQLFDSDHEREYDPPTIYPPIPPDERKPLRVLGLFDGIGTGYLVLKELGLQVEKYVASEVCPEAITVSCVHYHDIIHVGDITKITSKQMEELGPFDLIFGGSPCNDLSIVNPARKGIYDGTGKLFFDFYRLLQLAMPSDGEERPFFWLYENVVSMQPEDKSVICRFLNCNPVVVDAKEISPAHRARYFWGNLPGMNRPVTPLPSDRLYVQECLDQNCSRQTPFTKLRTITTKMNSIKQGKRYPVMMGGNGDVLWCTEMERLFGFPDHYTDVANLGRSGRQKLLGKAWSVPVIRHLLSPLKEYFRSSTTIEEGLGHVRPTGTSHRGAGWYVANGVNGISSPSGSRVISDMSSSSAVSKKK